MANNYLLFSESLAVEDADQDGGPSDMRDREDDGRQDH